LVATATFSQSGVYVLSLTADDTLATNTATVTVTVNQPPVVGAGAGQIVNLGAPVTLAGILADDGLPYNEFNAVWSEVSGPGTATFANAAQTNTTVSFDQPGTYTLMLTGDDGFATNSATVVIGVFAGRDHEVLVSAVHVDGERVAVAPVGKPLTDNVTAPGKVVPEVGEHLRLLGTGGVELIRHCVEPFRERSYLRGSFQRQRCVRPGSAGQIGRYHGPLLQAHGDADTIVPLRCGRRLGDKTLQADQTANGVVCVDRGRAAAVDEARAQAELVAKLRQPSAAPDPMHS